MANHRFKYLLIGILVLLLGASMNFCVVSLNGMQMPTSLKYIENCFTLVDIEGNRLEITPNTPVTLPSGRVFMDSSTRLKILGDIIYIENFIFHGYCSAGDILIQLGAMGIILWLVSRVLVWMGMFYHNTVPFRNKATIIKTRHL